MARYITRASFSQERMRYLEQDGTVVYRSKDGKDQKTFPTMEWLAATRSHNTYATLAVQIKTAAEHAHNHHIIRIQSLQFLHTSSTSTS
jgi:predicted dinucleotide-utilizing enzyme